jgi:hypothetical protein
LGVKKLVSKFDTFNSLAPGDFKWLMIGSSVG